MMTGMTMTLVETGQKRNIMTIKKAMTGNIGKRTTNTEMTTVTTTAEKGKKQGGKFRRGKGYGDQQNNKGRGKRASGNQCTGRGS
eukprot:7364149-Pyramimonas_sp.AAC.1